MARRFLNATLRSLDYEKKKLAFNYWCRNHNNDKSQASRETQSSLHEEILTSEVESGNLQTRQTKLVQAVTRSHNKRVSLSRKSLAKTIAQFGRYR